MGAAIVLMMMRHSRERRAAQEREAARSHLLLSREQIEARDHVLEVERVHGFPHSLTACPPPTRALCPYRRVIATMLPEDFQ